MPRFVILEHDHPHIHWDLMLEVGSTLKAWRLAKPPVNKGESIDAVLLDDHRVIYLDYEGLVSGARGTVTRWDAGNYESLAWEEERALHVLLKGSRIQGVGVLDRRDTGWVFLWS